MPRGAARSATRVRGRWQPARVAGEDLRDHAGGATRCSGRGAPSCLRVLVRLIMPISHTTQRVPKGLLRCSQAGITPREHRVRTAQPRRCLGRLTNIVEPPTPAPQTSQSAPDRRRRARAVHCDDTRPRLRPDDRRNGPCAVRTEHAQPLGRAARDEHRRVPAAGLLRRLPVNQISLLGASIRTLSD